jgi:hypothetical protein
MFFYSLLKTQKSRRESYPTPVRPPSPQPTHKRNIVSESLHSLSYTGQELQILHNANALPRQKSPNNIEELIGQSYSLTSAMGQSTHTMLQHINRTKPTSVSRSKTSKVKKSKAKGTKAKDEEANSKKRAILRSQMPRACKVVKTDAKDVTASMKPKEEANVKRRKTGTQKDVPIELTDSEDDIPLFPFIQRKSQPISSGPPESWSIDKIGYEDADTSLALPQNQSTISLKNAAILTDLQNIQIELKEADQRAAKLQTDLEAQMACTSKAQEESKAHMERTNDLRMKLELIKRDHATELRVIRHDNDKEVTEAVTQAVNHRLAEVDIEHKRKNYEAVNERARLSTELLQVRQERDELRRSLDTEIARSTSIEVERQKNASLIITLNFLQAETATLKTDLQQEREHHAKTKNDLDAHSNLVGELASLKAINEYLNKDIEALRHDADKRSTLSPTPTVSSAEEMKVENVRKTYIKVKMRYDTLYSIAKHLHVSTKSMNLTNFGEFGGYLKQLSAVMEEVDQEGGGTRGSDGWKSRDSGYAESIASSP